MEIERCEFRANRRKIDDAHLYHALDLGPYFEFQLGMHCQHESETAHHSPLLFKGLLIVVNEDECIEMVSDMHDELNQSPVDESKCFVEVLRKV